MKEDRAPANVPPVERGTLRRPGLAVTLLAAVALVCTVLGFWQLGRAEQSRAAAERFTAASELPAVRLRTAAGTDPGLRYRKVELAGRYVTEPQFLLDNIVQDGLAGYYVLTPFAPDDGGPWLIVNRGWIRGNPDRSVLPDVSIDDDERRIAGVLDALPSPGLRLDGEPPAPADAPVHVLSFPTLDQLERLLGRRLFGYQLLLDPAEPGGFGRDFPAPGLDPERHLAYAAQWWLFAAIAAGAACVIVWRLVRRRPL